MSDARKLVAKLLGEGLTQAEVARRIGVTPATVCHHARALGVAADERFSRRYDWAEIQAYYDAGHSISQCMKKFGFAKKTWHEARLRGNVISRPQAMPLSQLLEGRRGRGHLKIRLIKLRLKEEQCETCGLTEWRGEPLSLALHHVNGDPHDNSLENLQLLCPNCHSQTENVAGRNLRRGRPAA